jgi:crotonobetainyl-CoA:carnitine CoA-transferase CaiB-like acyl-CoA transferase
VLEPLGPSGFGGSALFPSGAALGGHASDPSVTGPDVRDNRPGDSPGPASPEASTEKPSTGPLSGIRIADFSRILAGPLCTMVLADLGADVVKIERPGTGDDTRQWGPPFIEGDAAYFLSLNRNKRSVALDLASAEGRDAAAALVRASDVVVENFRPGTMARFGLDWDAVHRAAPQTIYCSLTAYPDDDREARPGYDIIVQALSGLMSVTGEAGRDPVKVGVALLDVITGLHAANGIQAALIGRGRGAGGARVTVSLLEASIAALVNQAANFLLGGIVPVPMGTAHPNIVPYQTFRASDRAFVLAAGNDRAFRWTCDAIDRPALADDPRFATNGDRVRNRDELVRVLADAFAARPAGEWLTRLEAAGVPCSPVRAIDEVFSAPDGAATVQDVDDPARGRLRLVANPVHIDGSRPSVRRPPPRLGEHTDEVLGDVLGLSDAAIGRLHDEGVVAGPAT